MLFDPNERVRVVFMSATEDYVGYVQFYTEAAFHIRRAEGYGETPHEMIIPWHRVSRIVLCV
jgi:hypothetical protein